MPKANKEQTILHLHGIMATGHKAKTSDAALVTAFVTEDRKYSVVIRDDRAFLQTPHGHYQLTKHTSANRYQGTMNNIKVHITAKQIVGKIIYWA